MPVKEQFTYMPYILNHVLLKYAMKNSLLNGIDLNIAINMLQSLQCY